MSRTLLRRVAPAALAAVGVATVPLSRAPTLDAAGPASQDARIDRLPGTHRQLFAFPEPAGGIPLVHILDY